MSTHTITITGKQLDDIVFSLRCRAAEQRKLAETCSDIAILAEQKTSFAAEAKRFDDLASELNAIQFS